MEQEYGEQDTLNPEGEQDALNPEEEAVPETEEAEEVVEENPELKKAQELAKNYKIRAEKAEALAKQLKKPKEEATPKTADELSPTDLYVLIKANVPQEDIEEVKDYAKLKKISIAEALKTSFMKTLLSEREEERKTAEAANIAPAKRGTSKVSDEVLLDKLEKGELPEEDIDKAVKARINQKKKRA